MAEPSTGMKIKKGEVTFQSNVDHVMFTIEELIHSANRDVGKFLRRKITDTIFAEYKENFVKGAKVTKRKEKLAKKHINRTVSYWARKWELDLVIGYKHHNWMTQQELGEFNYPRLGAVRNTVFENIDEIRRIQSRYLTALSEKNPNSDNGMPDEGEGDDV